MVLISDVRGRYKGAGQTHPESMLYSPFARSPSIGLFPICLLHSMGLV